MSQPERDGCAAIKHEVGRKAVMFPPKFQLGGRQNLELWFNSHHQSFGVAAVGWAPGPGHNANRSSFVRQTRRPALAVTPPEKPPPASVSGLPRFRAKCRRSLPGRETCSDQPGLLPAFSTRTSAAPAPRPSHPSWAKYTAARRAARAAPWCLGKVRSGQVAFFRRCLQIPCPVRFPCGIRASRTSGIANFNTTHWTIVLACGDESDSGRAQQALASLFQTYWYPLYAYVRRRERGHRHCFGGSLQSAIALPFSGVRTRLSPASPNDRLAACARKLFPVPITSRSRWPFRPRS